MGDPWAQFGTKAGSMVQVGKALSVMGYSNWSALEPSKFLNIYTISILGSQQYLEGIPRRFVTASWFAKMYGRGCGVSCRSTDAKCFRSNPLLSSKLETIPCKYN